MRDGRQTAAIAIVPSPLFSLPPRPESLESAPGPALAAGGGRRRRARLRLRWVRDEGAPHRAAHSSDLSAFLLRV